MVQIRAVYKKCW